MNPMRLTISFPIMTSTVLMLTGAATNISLIISSIALKHFALLAVALINTSIFLIGAYYSRKYTLMQVNITCNQAYGPFPSVTLDGCTVTSERAPTPLPGLLSASMVAPALQQVPQASHVNNSGTQALNVAP